MDRRDFFRMGSQKAAKTAVKTIDEQVKARAQHWIRPPFAIDELEFLLACTRCGDCIKACPHQALFPLATRLGAQVAGTPALDLINNACHLCDDWPCVNACETPALTLPARPAPEESIASEAASQASENQYKPLPKMALANLDTETCLPYSGPECGACRDICPVPDAMTWSMEKPSIDQTLCVGCALCRQICITEPKSIRMQVIIVESAGC